MEEREKNVEWENEKKEIEGLSVTNSWSQVAVDFGGGLWKKPQVAWDFGSPLTHNHTQCVCIVICICVYIQREERGFDL